MNELFLIVLIAAITGAGLITGLLFAFSNFIMRALAELPADKGMFAMQRINETIINPLFLLIFFGTPVLCLLIAVVSIMNMNQSESLFLFSGALAYLIGPFGITVLFNVPLNNKLASANVSAADELWSMYQKRWQWWNHIRTYIGIVSLVLLAIGLVNVQLH